MYWYSSDSEIYTTLVAWYYQILTDLHNIILTVEKAMQVLRYNGGEMDNYQVGDPTYSNSLPLFPFGLIETNYDTMGYTTLEDLADGTLYPYFSLTANRAKGIDWWLRSGLTSSISYDLYTVRSDGYHSTDALDKVNNHYINNGLCFGFCIGKVAV